ncbi:hypothetical protein DRW03_15790 [Corallococcus sp. H22C18031201]|uniref:WD40/YVTN/BNR-like repeat-containing protein n=1 Tax=Citreicoccus inhibens TaxID=2849499 RepID=UPI000E7114DF|nr:sialidase family protein [Citreicoccus inhibens]MBU8900163.1 exo-alpha-sialidase [Citreicoccus inhibens]RJS21800.1 hypothetical protein DRW03_15790 [Corallococcus sp. H22C18031201]
MKTYRIAPFWRLFSVACVLAASGVRAHAGLPETSNVTLRRGHPEDFFVGTTFGAVVSRDSGQTWRWVCPEAMGYGGWKPDSFVWRESGELLAATGNALLRSGDGACTWSTHPYFKDTWVTALAVHPTDDRVFYAATGRSTAPSNGLYRSDDGGETWRALPLQRQNTLFSAVRVSTADPRRIYASAQEPTRMLLFRSDDAGETWEELPQTFPTLVRPYDFVLATTSPVSAEGVWARVSAQGFTYILRSDDGGRTFVSLNEGGLNDAFVNMDLSADGGTAWVGTYNTFFRSQAGAPFVPLSLPSGNACVLRRGEVLYGCGSPWVHDWSLARSLDEGTTWEPIYSLEQTRGAYRCPAGTPVHELCPSRWPQLAQLILAPLDPDGEMDAGTPDAGTPPPAPDAGPGVDEPPPSKPSSSGCGAMSGNAVPAALLLLTLSLLRRGRRRVDPQP